MMNFALVFDNNQYQFAQVLANDKKACHIHILDATHDKKIKNDYLIHSFSQDPRQLQPELEQTQAEIDLDLLWELSAEQELWSWQKLADLYFGQASLAQQLALFLAISQPAIYFTYQGNHQFKRCGHEEVSMRQLQVQRQQEYQAKFDDLYQKLSQFQTINWQIDPLQLLNQPDKNSLEYKVVNKVCKDLKLSLPELFFKLGYISSIEDLLITSFVKQYFPQGTALPAFTIDDHAEDLPFSPELNIFSIDDALTTEIDDAFSVQVMQDGYLIGIHIAAPALNRQLLMVASDRLSTVYYPGHKITMLPENVIAHYSLEQGRQLPVVSIYFQLDAEFNIIDQYSKLEQVIVRTNLRTESLEQFFNNDNLNQEHGYPYEGELKILHRFALKLEEKRGRASVNQLMVDYNFAFSPDGKIQIKPRLRGNPIDKLVSELMILANCSWGRMLTNSFIPAIYRVKQPMQPVTMTLTPNSHSGLNVDYYTWASSPLRRAVDLVNQAQIISLLTNDKALTATDPALAYVVENFDQTYAAYLKFQDRLERYWSLRYLEQEQISQIQATYTYRNNVQLAGVPITLDLTGVAKAQPSGTSINLAIANFNFITQTFDYRIVD